MTQTLLAGMLLGVLSRIEERAPGFSLGISSDAAWLTTAFLAGVLSQGSTLLTGAARGAASLTAANSAYYALIASTEPGIRLADVAGPPLVWLSLGGAGGGLMALSGHLWRTRPAGTARLASAVPLAAVCIAEGITSLRGGPLTDLPALLVGVLLLTVSARNASPATTALAAAIPAATYIWHLETFLP